jgi:hypothetical protein
MPKQNKPADPSFPLSAIVFAMRAARIPDELRKRVVEELQASRPKRGRKPVDDDIDVGEVVVLHMPDRDGKGLSINAASKQVASKYPESQRSAVAKRLAKKAGEIFKQVDQDTAREAQQAYGLQKRVRELEKLLAEKGIKI